MGFGHYQVDPGQSRPTETLLIGYFEDARLGLEAYAVTKKRIRQPLADRAMETIERDADRFIRDVTALTLR